MTPISYHLPVIATPHSEPRAITAITKLSSSEVCSDQGNYHHYHPAITGTPNLLSLSPPLEKLRGDSDRWPAVVLEEERPFLLAMQTGTGQSCADLSIAFFLPGRGGPATESHISLWNAQPDFWER